MTTNKSPRAGGALSVEDLAAEFSGVVREWLTPEQLAEVIERNKTRHPGICHTHDFMDANEAMMEAFERLGYAVFDESTEQVSDDTCELWNAAWDLAITNEFREQT